MLRRELSKNWYDYNMFYRNLFYRNLVILQTAQHQRR